MNIFLKLTILFKSYLITDLSVKNSRMVFVYNLNGSGTDQKRMRLKIKLKC